ncbi:MAG: FMN-binding protein [Gemmatimonadota bacterium]|nr:FMN-binding protein [Gemmatimonadota bacterium]
MNHRIGSIMHLRERQTRSLHRRPALLLLVASLSLVVAPLQAQSVPARKLMASLERVYGRGLGADSLSLDGAVVLRVRRHDSVLGFAQVRDVMGKDQPITYLVATDTALVLRDIDILIYREPYGGEVAYEAWRKQFRGRDARDSLVVGRQIRGISGATISVHAVTLGVRQALRQLAEWRRDGRL